MIGPTQTSSAGGGRTHRPDLDVKLPESPDHDGLAGSGIADRLTRPSDDFDPAQVDLSLRSFIATYQKQTGSVAPALADLHRGVLPELVTSNLPKT